MRGGSSVCTTANDSGHVRQEGLVSHPKSLEEDKDEVSYCNRLEVYHPYAKATVHVKGVRTIIADPHSSGDPSMITQLAEVMPANT